ncbi:MAG: twin-arginine translocation signal domain-containing protein [Coriobacteriia bacterium]|nr:twin-arginine translocation signal domain-containing protein [Coriobacteriia bacterium]
MATPSNSNSTADKIAQLQKNMAGKKKGLGSIIMQKSSEPIGRNMSRRRFLQLGAVGGALTAPNSVFSGCSSVTHKLFDASILDDVSAEDIITLGTVRLTDNWLRRFSKDLEWRVLDVEDNRVLVITRNIIDLVDFNEKRRGWEGVRSWGVNNMRQWLNSEFLSGNSACLRVKMCACGLVLVL